MRKKQGKKWPNQQRNIVSPITPIQWIRRKGTLNKVHVPNVRGVSTICTRLLPKPEDREEVKNPIPELKCPYCVRELERREIHEP